MEIKILKWEGTLAFNGEGPKQSSLSLEEKTQKREPYNECPM